MPITKQQKKRQRRLIDRKAKLADEKCLNCTILIAETLQEHKRSYKYCRYCIESGEARKDRWRRYYHRNRETFLPKMSKKTKLWKFRKAVQEASTQQTTLETMLSLDRITQLREISSSY